MNNQLLSLLIAASLLLCGFNSAAECNVPLQQQIPPNQYAALVDLYNATGGNNWYYNTGWLTTSSSWYGVGVQGVQYDTNCNVIALGYVAVLDLDTNNLIGTLPSSLAELTGLGYLSMAGYKYNYTNLVTLNIPTNSISGNIPDIFGTMTHLGYVDLSENTFTGNIPASLYGNPNNANSLELLNLGANQLTGDIPLGLSNLGNLRTLDLSQNGFGGTIPDFWTQFPKLQSLVLAGNDLVGQIPSSMTLLPEALNIDVSGNQLYGNVPQFGPPLFHLGIEGNWFDVNSGSIPLSNIIQMIDNGMYVTYEPNGIYFPLLRVPLDLSSAGSNDCPSDQFMRLI
jgi:hypothetical protein